MARFEVDSELVAQASVTVRGSIERIRHEVTAMHGHLLDLQGSWRGSAAEAFQSVVVDWKGTQQRVEESLEAINQALAQAGAHYADVEAVNQRMFGH